MTEYQDNLDDRDLQADIDDSVQFLLQHAQQVTLGSWERLEKVLGEVHGTREPPTLVDYNAEFSIAGELQSQIQAVRAVRDRILNADGGLITDISTREAKEVISSGSTLMATLMKYHEKVVNMERMRLLEQSVVEALGEVDEPLRDRALAVMEDRLTKLA